MVFKQTETDLQSNTKFKCMLLTQFGWVIHLILGLSQPSLGNQLVQSGLLACGFSPQSAVSNLHQEEGNWNRKYGPADFLIKFKTFCSGVKKARLSGFRIEKQKLTV